MTPGETHPPTEPAAADTAAETPAANLPPTPTATAPPTPSPTGAAAATTPTDQPATAPPTTGSAIDDSGATVPPTPTATKPATATSPPTQPATTQPATTQPATTQPATTQPATAKPLRGPLAARGLGVAKPASPAVDRSKLSSGNEADQSESAKNKPAGNKKSRSAPRPKLAGDRRGPKPATPVRSEQPVRPGQPASPEHPGDAATIAAGQSASQTNDDASQTDQASDITADASNDSKPQRGGRSPRPGKVAVPNLRNQLDDDLQAELDAAFAGDGEQLVASAVDTIPRRGEPIVDGSRVHAVVLKIHDGNVFVALGGPDEGQVPFEQFETEPSAGDQVEVVVRGLTADGLYQCSLPGGAIEVSDWDDLQEGSVVEATVTATNTGGLEAKVGGVSGFIPISQISEYRVEDTSEFVNQKFLCVVTEANPRRRNLVLSRRAILEREREEKKKEQLAKIEPGDEIEGTVRSVKDFGAFVDLGALDGLIHISKLSWERVKHPSEVLEVGQQVKVRIDKVDKETGKIALSYRDLLENPWDAAEADFAPGTVHKGTVTKVAPFGCFVRLAPGIEGMVHISELANHRVTRVDTFVNEGDAVEVKVLTFDRDAQKISLSIKQASQAGAPVVREEDATPAPEVSIKPQHAGPLKGGNNRDTGGEKFGLRW